MIPLTLNNKEYLLVEVPEDNDAFFRGVCDDSGLIRIIKISGERIKLPFDCNPISLLKDLTEEQAASMVERSRMSDLYLDYVERDYSCSALESFSSFLRSHGVDDSKNYLLLKKI